jgi:eukaryotic-like serine/threonine-protein kinase
MTEVDVSRFLEPLGDERFLEPEQFDELTGAMLPLCQEPLILAKELAYRGWLTPYQAEQILTGQADALILGSYVLLEPIGEGGMGRVYRARNWKLNRIVAIKLIGEERMRQPAAMARFQREIRALGRIRHPNIVMAIDAEFRSDALYFAMEYFEGVNLAHLVAAEGPLSMAAACSFIMQTADALQHAHEMGLVHRDIKPSNLLRTEPQHTIKLLDLGLTRCEVPVDDSIFNELTRAGAVIGTPDYMSPEQVKDSRSTDIRSDLYSLGCTFYYLLTGRAPFHHLPAIVDKLYAQCEADPVPIESLRPDVPAEVAGIIRKLLAKRRRDRFQTPAELVDVLQALLDERDASHDTCLNAEAVTLIDAPALPPWAIDLTPARTVALSHSEINFVTRPDDDEQPMPARTWRNRLPRATHFIISVLLAALALAIMWKSGAGPATTSVQAPAVEAAKPLTDDAAAVVHEREGLDHGEDHASLTTETENDSGNE